MRLLLCLFIQQGVCFAGKRDVGVQVVLLFLQQIAFFLCFFKQQLLLGQQRRQRPHQFVHFVNVRILQPLADHSAFGKKVVGVDGRCVARNLLIFAANRMLQILVLGADALLYAPIDIRTENLAENLLPLLWLAEQQVAEFSLCNHGCLRKLLVVDAQYAFDFW